MLEKTGLVLLAVLIILPSCCKSNSSSDGASAWLQAPVKGEAVAEVNGAKISMDEFKDRMEKQSPYIRSRYNTMDKKKEFLENMIQFELLTQAAIQKGYDKDPEVLRSAKQVMTQKFMREEFDNKVKPEDVNEADIKKHFEDNRQEYNKPAMARVSHILIKVPENAAENVWQDAKKKALEILKEAKAVEKDPNEFRKLAIRYSEDESNKNRGGDVGYFARTEDGGPMTKEFSDAAFAMQEVNEIAGPVRTTFGWHILRLTGKRDKIERTYEQVRSQIQHQIFKERRTKLFDDFLKSLKDKAKVSMNDKLLESYEIPGARPGENEGPAGMEGAASPPVVHPNIKPIEGQGEAK